MVPETFAVNSCAYSSVVCGASNRAFARDVTSAILGSQTSPVGIELFSYVNSFFCRNQFAWLLAKWVKTPYSRHAVRKMSERER